MSSINNNSSLFKEFIQNAVTSPSPKVQKNFMEVMSSVTQIFKKICDDENSRYEQKRLSMIAKNSELYKTGAGHH